MALGNKPVRRYEIHPKNALDEYKVLAEEIRFVASKYTQVAAIYLALIGFALREIFVAPSVVTSLVIAYFVALVNFSSYYGANKFRSMAYHSLERLALLTDHLGLQRPHPMIWGYRVGMAVFLLTHISLIVIIVVYTLKLLLP